MSSSLLRLSAVKDKNKEKEKNSSSHSTTHHQREQKERPVRLSIIVVVLSAVVCLSLILFTEKILSVHLTIPPTSVPSKRLKEPVKNSGLIEFSTTNSLESKKYTVDSTSPSVVDVDSKISPADISNGVSDNSPVKANPSPLIEDKDNCTASGSKIPLSLLNRAEICKEEDVRHYRVSRDSSSEGNDRAWCIASRRRNNVVIGHSWGSLRKDEILKWDKVNCNELLKVGKRLPCSRRWGWQFFEDWLSLSRDSEAVQGDRDRDRVSEARKSKMATLQHIVTGPSTVTCAVNFKASAFCKLNNVRMDFSKMEQLHLVRSFSQGFVTVFGERSGPHSMPGIPGLDHRSGSVPKDFLLPSQGYCDVVEDRPTFILSNDDIFNLGHFSNDLMNIWNMLVLANKDSKQSVLINIDGYRVGGPAGGPSHRMMVPEHPDSHGPYVGYYESWFAEVKRAVDFKGKRVCFTGELFLPPDPGVAWFWNDWGQVNDCSMQAASPLYQSFNLFLRERWQAHFGPSSLIYPAEVYSDYRTVLAEKLASPKLHTSPSSSSSESSAVKNIHVVIEVRSINKSKRNNHSSARHIANLAEVIAALKAIAVDNAQAQDFAQLSFAEQVRLSHSASVFLSMHGAGTTHIFHMAVGQASCCALVEMFPDSTIEFQSAQGYGNIARMLGLHHYRYEARLGSTRPEGTTVDVMALQGIVRQAVQAVVGRPTCLHDVRDTRCPIYPNGTLT